MQSNTQYWQSRLEKLNKSLMLSQEKNTVTFLKVYKGSLTEVQTYVNTLYSKYSKDGVLSMTEMNKLNRFSIMEKEITSIITNLGGKEKAYMTNELTNTYKSSFLKTGAILKEGIPNLAVSFTKIPTGFVEKALTYPWSGLDYSSRIWKNKEVLISNLEQTLTRGFIQGNSISNMTKDLKGVMDVSATSARRLIRTETQHIMSASHHDTYKQAGVEKVKYLATDDDRTCDECLELDGKVFNLEDAPMTPIHANSRSIVVPYFED